MKDPERSRWFSLEFLFYYAFLGWAYVAGTWQALQFSDEYASAPYRYVRGLQPGWIPGRQVDLSDHQWRFFRENLPLLSVAAAGYLAASWLVRKLTKQSYQARLVFNALFSLGFLLFANGSGAFFATLIVTANFLIAKQFRTSLANPILTWIFALAVLIANERYDGYSFSMLFGYDSPLARQLDRNKGLFRWHTLFNLVILRMISFNMDYYWCCNGRTLTDKQGRVITFEKHADGCEQCQVAQTGLPREEHEKVACLWWR